MSLSDGSIIEPAARGLFVTITRVVTRARINLD